MKKFITGLVIGISLALAPMSFAMLAQPKSFSDVPNDSWYHSAVYQLADAYIIEGYDDETFRPSEYVNRAEMAKMLAVLHGTKASDAKVEALKAEVEALSAKLNTLDFEGACYYEDKWYVNGDKIDAITLGEENDLKGVIENSLRAGAPCFCKESGVIECASYSLTE